MTRPIRQIAARFRRAATLAAVAGSMALLSPVSAQDAPQSEAQTSAGETLDGPFNALERKAIRNLVRNYILENPEIIPEAVQILREQQKQAKAEQQQAAVKTQETALNDPGMLPVLGNPEGDVTVVEFFDYNCPYCRGITKQLIETVRADGNVRLILKELPILRESSRTAARAAVAAAQQGAYAEFHERLMTKVQGISEDSIMALAERMELDTAQLQADMTARATEKYLSETQRLARDLQIGGTPAFVVGGELVSGAIGRERLEDLIAQARERES